MEKEIKLGVYRILRKLGVHREEIYPEAKFSTDYFFDDKDWNCFLFFIESKFDISISDDEQKELVTVGTTIDFVDKHKQAIPA
jgi:acyl carrier protein